MMKDDMSESVVISTRINRKNAQQIVERIKVWAIQFASDSRTHTIAVSEYQ